MGSVCIPALFYVLIPHLKDANGSRNVLSHGDFQGCVALPVN